MKAKIKQKTLERLIYIAIIVGLVIYGLWNTDPAIKLIEAVKSAFLILL